MSVCAYANVSNLSSSLHGWVRARSGDDVITDVFLCSMPLRLSSWCFIHTQQSNLYLFFAVNTSMPSIERKLGIKPVDSVLCDKG